MKIQTEDFLLGNFENKAATDSIVEAINADEFDADTFAEAGVGGDFDDDDEDAGINHNVRKCKTKWIPVDELNFIEQGMSQMIKHANNMMWDIKLNDEWDSDIQVTYYAGKGHFYNWHKDHYGDIYSQDEDDDSIRRVTVVYCLSPKSDYTGGEFQIKQSNGKVYTRRFDYGDFIIFPSDRLHRVKKLKGGKRLTLVGWYR